MPKDNSAQAKDLADQYLKLLAYQKTIQSQIDELKKQMADFCRENETDNLVSGNNR